MLSVLTTKLSYGSFPCMDDKIFPITEKDLRYALLFMSELMNSEFKKNGCVPPKEVVKSMINEVIANTPLTSTAN
jgi:hypothetical protein